MKTLVVNELGVLEIREVPMPKYNDNQALVKTISCGICNGTDLKLIHKSFKGVFENQYPLMLGHEGVGKVVKIGKNVKSFKVGDVVLLPFVDACKETFGELGSGWGAFSEYGIVNDKNAFEAMVPECAFAQTIVPSNIDSVDAAMIITLREVLSSIKRFGMKKNESVVVFGCGPVGLTFIKLMKLLGVGPIVAFDLDEAKIKPALEQGADYAFVLESTNVKTEICNICPQGVKYVLDAVGVLPLINQGMDYLCDGGKICCYGISAKTNMNLEWSNAPYNWQLHFQQFPSKIEEGEATQQILDWIENDTINLKDYISDYFEFENILAAFNLLQEKKISKKGIVVY